MRFEDLLVRLHDGETFEKISNEFCKANNLDCFVACDNNEVYEDDDLYEFLGLLGAEIEDFALGFALIKTSNDSYYEVPYKNIENRYDKTLSDETVLFFDTNRIYNVSHEHN